MKRISSIVFAICFAALALALFPGCRPGECQKMSRCCEAIEDEEGVGGACDLSQGLEDPDTCRSVLHAVEAMYRERNEPMPAVCE